MKIDKALEPTGMASKDDNEAEYAMLVEDKEAGERKNLLWNGVDGEFVHYTDITEEDWQPYHKVKEIRPEKEQEVWLSDDTGVWITHKNANYEIVLIAAHSLGSAKLCDIGAIHNKNGWTRLYPQVEDDSVEEREIEHIVKDEGSFFLRDTHDNLHLWKDSEKPIKLIAIVPKEKL